MLSSSSSRQKGRRLLPRGAQLLLLCLEELNLLADRGGCVCFPAGCAVDFSGGGLMDWRSRLDQTADALLLRRRRSKCRFHGFRKAFCAPNNDMKWSVSNSYFYGYCWKENRRRPPDPKPDLYWRHSPLWKVHHRLTGNTVFVWNEDVFWRNPQKNVFDKMQICSQQC